MKKRIGRIDEKNIANNGLVMTIIAYRDKDDIDLQFEDGTIVYNKNYFDFRKGQIEHPTLKCTTHTAVKGTLFNIGIEDIAFRLGESEEVAITYYHDCCPICGDRSIKTVEEIREHNCSKKA